MAAEEGVDIFCDDGDDEQAGLPAGAVELEERLDFVDGKRNELVLGLMGGVKVDQARAGVLIEHSILYAASVSISMPEVIAEVLFYAKPGWGRI